MGTKNVRIITRKILKDQVQYINDALWNELVASVDTHEIFIGQEDGTLVPIEASGRDFVQNPIQTNEIANESITYDKVIPGVFARKINHTPVTYTIADIVRSAMIVPLFGLKTITIPDDGTVDPENLKDLFIDIYGFMSNSQNPNSYWAYITYNENDNVYALYDIDNIIVHTFYDFGTNTWDSEYTFPENLWNQMMVVDITRSEWTTNPIDIIDFNYITIDEGLLTLMDLEEAFYFTLQGLAAKVEIDQTLSNVGSVMAVNPQGFVVPTILSAQNIFYDPLHNEQTELVSDNIQNAIDELDIDMRYNSIYKFDATIQSAPPNMPRGYNWRVEIDEPLINEHQYSRYFYSTFEDAMLDVTGTPNIQDAVAHWVIDGRHIYFEYLSNGVVNTIVDITDVSGNVLIPQFRPIPISNTWFFGEVQSVNDFPIDETIRSIIDINVPGLYLMLGNTIDLDTDQKQIVGAINEVNSKVGTIDVYEVESGDSEEALQYSANNPNTFVFISRS